MKTTMQWLGWSLFFGVWLCGMSFDQLREFDLAERPAHDAHSYVNMAHGNYSVTPHHKYRVIIPNVVRALRAGLPAGAAASPNADKALFFAVNLALGGLMLAVSRRLLLASGASPMSALVVVLLLGGCRFILQAAAQPMIDMGLYLALAALAYFLATGQWGALCLWLPVMALSKEVIYPLLVLPIFLVPQKRRFPLVCSYLVSGGLIYWVRHWVAVHSIIGMVSTIDPGWSYQTNSMFEVVAKQWNDASKNLVYLATPRGLFDITIAFGALWLLAIYGLKHQGVQRNRWLWFFLPYALWCGLLSRHWGRMLTIAFPLVIFHAALGLDCLLARFAESKRQPAI